jgi:hypothetical protein
MSEQRCQSCLMPFSKDKGVRESDKYCSYCFKGGKLCYEGDNFDEFKKVAYENMVKGGMNKFKARILSWSMRFAPRWKNKNK